MSIWWEALPLVTLAGTTLFCAVKWRGEVRRAGGQALGWELAAETSEQRRLSVDKLAGELAAYEHADGKYKASASFWQRRSSALQAALTDAEDRLRKIKQQRHLSAKHAARCGVEKRRATIHAQAELIRRQTAEKEAA